MCERAARTEDEAIERRRRIANRGTAGIHFRLRERKRKTERIAESCNRISKAKRAEKKKIGGFVKNVKCNVTKGRAWKMRTGEAFIHAYREGDEAQGHVESSDRISLFIYLPDAIQ